MDMKRFFLYFIVIAALALAGCGGNGGRTTMMPDPDPEPPAPMTHDIDLGMLLTGYTTVPAGTYEIDAGESMDVGHATFMCPAGGVDCSVTVAADGTATSTGGAATATASQAAMDAKDEADMAAADADKAEQAKFMGVATAIGRVGGAMEVGKSTENGLPGSATITRATTGDPKITLMNDDTTLTDPDIAFDPKYEVAMTDPLYISGWKGQVQRRSPDNEPMDEVTIYTDIKNARPQKLKYNNDGASTSVAIPVPTAAGNLIVLGDDDLSYTGSDIDNDDDETVTGTVNGIPGTFTCTTGTCSVTFADEAPGRAENTVATITGAGWTFESDENVESQATQDNDYLYFGYWLQTADDNKFAFNTFFGGNQPFALTSDLTTNTTFTAADSTATFSGNAGGKYVEKTLAIKDGALDVTRLHVGHFTADANLTAYFGTSTGIAANKHNTISGTINNFMDGDKELNFSVTLNSINFGTDGDNISHAGGTFGSTDADVAANKAVSAIHGTTQNMSGGWNGGFFGLSSAETSSTTDTDANVLPTGVAGEFNAHFSDGHVVGSFGATR